MRIQRLGANSVDLDEVVHYEPPQQDLRCLQIQLFSSQALKEVNFDRSHKMQSRLYDVFDNLYFSQFYFHFDPMTGLIHWYL